MNRFEVEAALAQPEWSLPQYEGWDHNLFGEHPRDRRRRALQIRDETAGMGKEEKDKYYQDLRGRTVNNFYSTIEAFYCDRRVVLLTAAEEEANKKKYQKNM
jgi:hypothetical protein